MEQKYYTVEKGQQMLISLLKQNGIRKIIASPGTTNITFVASVMHDSYFQVYSSVDERSAAYMAVGMAEETGEVIVLSCTGATASRNYIPGLTEAYYRKLPILAVTATQNENRIGHLVPQMMDRTQQLRDICVHSEHVPVPRDEDDLWNANIRLNRAILALRHHGGGPVHINLATTYNMDFSVKELPMALCIHRYTNREELPPIPKGRVGILVGNHLPWTKSQTENVNRFCAAYGAVVFCEHASNYVGKYRVFNAIVSQQDCYGLDSFRTDLLIHIGEVSGYGNWPCCHTKEVWRISEDGELRDPYRKLTNVFEMREEDFFAHYAEVAKDNDVQKADGERWLQECHEAFDSLHAEIRDLPFSNVWVANQTAEKLPENSVLHVGILNSLRAWNFFNVPDSIKGVGFVNTGGFGIDGCMSAMLGGAMVNSERLHFLMIGDLSFFYDLNSLGNRHIGNNVRILLVNNGKGTEFRNYFHSAAIFGDDADDFIAAAGHYGDKSANLVKHYAEDLGFKYMQASTKDEFLKHLPLFVTSDITDSPMLLEVFTNSQDESEALYQIGNLITDKKQMTVRKVKSIVRDILPESLYSFLKKLK